MTGPKVEFTKRLGVRLGAVSAVLALGAAAAAWAFWPQGKPVADASNPDSKTEHHAPDSSLSPIRMPEDEGQTDGATGESTADTRAEARTVEPALASESSAAKAGAPSGDLPQAPAPARESSLAIAPAASPDTGIASLASYEASEDPESVQLTVPSPGATVMRANDGEAQEASSQPAPASPAPTRVTADTDRGGSFVVPSSLTPDNSTPHEGAEPSPAPANGPSDATPDAGAVPSKTIDSATGSQPSEWAGKLRSAARAAAGAGHPNDDPSAPSTRTPAPADIAPPSFHPPAVEPSRLAVPSPPVQTPGTPTEPMAASSRFSNAPGGASEVPAASSPLESPRSLASSKLDGDGVPGPETLEGTQSPALTLEKNAPAEIQVGKETTFELKIRNVGKVAAHDVIVLDRVPRGTRFVSATPASSRGPEGQLMWQLGTLQPGDEAVISVQLLPLAEGEIGSVAQVLFQAHASVRTICTKPELTLAHTGPKKVLIGEPVAFDITVTNPGTGAATGVVVEEDVPEGLTHIAGKELEYEIGTLKPGETRRMQLTLKADKPGIVQNVLLVRGDGNLIAKDTWTLEVVAPKLQVALDGPSLRFLEREAVYDVVVSNTGTAAAREVELVAYLPRGMKFVSADHKGQYEPQNHAVYWSLEELPPNQTGVAKLTLLPLETGEQKLSLEGRAELGLKDSNEKIVQVDSLAELQFTIADSADPIEVDTETTYVITLSNSGSSAATNIQLAVRLPPELEAISGDGPTRVVINGSQVSIDPLARLAPGEQTAYRLKVRGLAAGPQRIQVQLVTAETPVPVTKEEVTRVYSDR